MDTKTLKEQIASLNLQVDNLNAQRARNIGKKETLEAQKAKLIAQYEATYGVHLTDENIESEFQRVVAEKTKEAKLLAEVLHSIQSGNYAHANALMGVKADEAPVYSSDDMIIRKGELEHKSYEVGTDGVVATQMQKNAEAVSTAQAVMSNADASASAVTEKTAEVFETPQKPAVRVGAVEDEEDDGVVPTITPKVSAKPAIKMPVGFDDDEDDGVIPSIAPKVAVHPKTMTKQSAPMDALEGFTAPQQTAPKAVDAFDTAPSVSPNTGTPSGVSSKAKSFSELFGGNFGV